MIGSQPFVITMFSPTNRAFNLATLFIFTPMFPQYNPTIYLVAFRQDPPTPAGPRFPLATPSKFILNTDYEGASHFSGLLL